MKKVLLNQDSAAGGTPPRETLEQTNQRQAARIAELEGKLEKFETVEAQRAADEKVISEKMAHGLSRQQAINVIRRQRDFDAAAEEKSIRLRPTTARQEVQKPKSKAK